MQVPESIPQDGWAYRVSGDGAPERSRHTDKGDEFSELKNSLAIFATKMLKTATSPDPPQCSL